MTGGADVTGGAGVTEGVVVTCAMLMFLSGTAGAKEPSELWLLIEGGEGGTRVGMGGVTDPDLLSTRPDVTFTYHGLPMIVETITHTVVK